MTMMLIGVDPHKSTSTATAVEPESNREVASIRIEATLREYRRLLTWAGRWPERRWAIENAEGLGRHLASWLLARCGLIPSWVAPRPSCRPASTLVEPVDWTA